MSSATTDPQPMRVGALRPNQLLHTYGVGAMADLPNLSVVMLGLDHWELQRAAPVTEQRLLSAVRAKLGHQVGALRMPPQLSETVDPFAEWARVGVPVGLFPRWLRCSDTRCNRLATAESGLFELLASSYQTEKIRYVHTCRGSGGRRPTAVPARFVLACDNGHLDDFAWSHFAHYGSDPGPGHPLKLSERGSTGETANILVTCDDCGGGRSMSQAFGQAAADSLPSCRGRHPHLGTFEPCTAHTRTLVLGATNSWFAMQLRVFSLPRAENPVDQIVTEFWGHLELLTNLEADTAAGLLPNLACWPELEPYGTDAAMEAIQRRATAGADEDDAVDDLDLLAPEWSAFSSGRDVELPDFTTRRQRALPTGTGDWLSSVVLVPRLREVAALYGFTRIDAPEWEVLDTPDTRRVALTAGDPTWVPCAEMRGEGIFLQFDEKRVTAWEQTAAARERGRLLTAGHDHWRAQRRLPPGQWPGLRYILLHTLAHTLIREFALECGYSASGIGERVYARPGEHPMAGLLLYTAAPDSEGTLGGLVALGDRSRLGPLLERALDAARLCSSDPLCAEHDPTLHGRLSGAACHACLYASETSCERGNHYLDRALLVDTLTDTGAGFFSG